MAAVFLKAPIPQIHPKDKINMDSLRGFQGCFPCHVENIKKKQLVS